MKQFIELEVRNENRKMLVNVSQIVLVLPEKDCCAIFLSGNQSTTRTSESYDDVISKIKEANS